MREYDKKPYDAVIIGAGISGLICGCYLAKSGLKVLIAEQHYKPGGYCTSFKRQNFTFDAAPHCFGSYREGGVMRKILKDLEVDKKLTIIRPDPSDIIITPDYEISFWNNLEKTIDELQAVFPEESNNIKNFFYLLIDSDPNSFSRMRSLTFKKLLDQYFTNDKLKAILSFPFLGIGGLPPSMISAFVGAKLYSEFLFDGGYYPKGGMQAIPDALARKFKEFGGELRLSSLVNKIEVRDNKVTGIVVDNDVFIPARYVISNCDARQTFLKLLDKEKIEKIFYHKITNMIPSISNLILYLGINDYSKSLPKPGTTFSFFKHYDVEKAYQAAQKGDFEGYGGYMMRVSHDKSIIIAVIPAPYKNKQYWENNKYKLLDYFIAKIEKSSIPDLSKYIIHKEAATPHTLYRFTLNYKGASFGWASIPSQFALTDFRKPSFVQNLYLTGHWTTLGIGISGAAYVGYDTAKIILRKEKI
jgi:phytoene dehydrogenase-like protein